MLPSLRYALLGVLCWAGRGCGLAFHARANHMRRACRPGDANTQDRSFHSAVGMTSGEKTVHQRSCCVKRLRRGTLPTRRDGRLRLQPQDGKRRLERPSSCGSVIPSSRGLCLNVSGLSRGTLASETLRECASSGMLQGLITLLETLPAAGRRNKEWAVKTCGSHCS